LSELPELADAVPKLDDESRGKLSDAGQGGDAGVGDDALSSMTIVALGVLLLICHVGLACGESNSVRQAAALVTGEPVNEPVARVTSALTSVLLFKSFFWRVNLKRPSPGVASLHRLDRRAVRINTDRSGRRSKP